MTKNVYVLKQIPRRGWRGKIDSLFTTPISDFEIYKGGKKVRTLRNWKHSYACLVIDILNDELKNI